MSSNNDGRCKILYSIDGIYDTTTSLSQTYLASIRALTKPPSKLLSSVNVAFETCGPSILFESSAGLLIEYDPVSTFCVSIVHTPSPPVRHGISGKTPLSKSHGDSVIVLDDGAGVNAATLIGGDDKFGGSVGWTPVTGGSVGKFPAGGRVGSELSAGAAVKGEGRRTF